MEKVIIVRYCEIHLKGNNRGFFERVFAENMEKALKGVKHVIKKQSGRYVIEDFADSETEYIENKIKKVFGVHTLSIALKVNTSLDEIFEAVKAFDPKTGTFKIETHRADKTFPLNSMQIGAEMGGRLLDFNHNLHVDVHNPKTIIGIDLRENGTTLVFSDMTEGVGGMPVGTAGKGMLLISGGIDSPVAGYMMAKRGMKIECIHFHSYPYTNMQAKEKVEELAGVLGEYSCGTTLNVVKVTHIQEEIHKKCNGDFMVTLLRRFMMRIAERLAKKCGAQCLITGESLGQVASQTIEGMTSSGSVVQDLPILRPLCGFDKNEIIARSRSMGAYDISIRPYEDCCTVFLPKHPVIHPKISEVLEEESKLDIEGLISEAISTLEVIKI